MEMQGAFVAFADFKDLATVQAVVGNPDFAAPPLWFNMNWLPCAGHDGYFASWPRVTTDANIMREIALVSTPLVRLSIETPLGVFRPELQTFFRGSITAGNGQRLPVQRSPLSCVPLEDQETRWDRAHWRAVRAPRLSRTGRLENARPTCS